MKLYENYGYLEQDRLLHVVDESMYWTNMDLTGDIIPNGGGGGRAPVDDGSMVSNLPLLFANGYPTSLDKITLPELERFIAFMVQCSLGQNSSGAISEPQWWPKEVKFSIPLVRPKKVNDINDEDWMGNLKKLVYRCYTYHRGEYLLRFCSYISQVPHNKLEFVNNWDTTTSLYIRGKKTLLVTFRNENMNYDKKVESPRKSLLPPNSNIGTLPPDDDIYLCDNCDAELVGYEQMKAHEGLCCEQEQSSSRPTSPDEISQSIVKSEIKQDQFLQYFKLFSSKPPPSNSADASRTPNPLKQQQLRSSRRCHRSSINLTRYSSIPFSSPAGLYLAKKSKMMTEEVQMERLDRVERHLTAPALSGACRPKWLDRGISNERWNVSFKVNRDKQHIYAHEYSFKPYRRKLVLDLDAQLLYIAVNCRETCVALTRYTEQQLAELKRHPDRYVKYEKPIQRLVQPRPKLKPTRRLARPAAELIVIDDDEPDEPDDDNNNRSATSDHNGTPSLAAFPSFSAPPGGGATSIIEVDLCSSDDEASRLDALSPASFTPQLFNLLTSHLRL